MLAFAMGDSLYPTSNGRLPNPNQTWTPQSAVSSFNLPAEYNLDLTTPVSHSVETPTIHNRASALSQWSQNNLGGMNYAKDASSISNSSMKSKNFSQSMHASDANINPSLSPYIFESPQSAYPHTPYTSDYSISAHPDNNPSMTSPATASTHSSKHNSISQPPLSAGSLNQAPILGNPTPEALRPQKRLHDSISSQGSQPLNHAVRNEPESISQGERRSQGQTSSIFIQEESPPFKLQPNKRVRTSSTDSSAIIHLPGGAQLISDRLTEEERYLFRLRDEVRDKDGKKHSWTETTAIFNETFGKQDKVPALQMKYFRAKDKCRDWTDRDTHALESAMNSYIQKKWHVIAKDMVNHGCEQKWHSTTCQRKYAELHPESEEGKADSEHTAIKATYDPELNAKYNDSEGYEVLAVEDLDDERLSPQSRRGSSSTKARRRRPRKRDSERSAATSASTPIYEKQQVWMVQPQHVSMPAVTVSMAREGDLAAYAPYSAAP